MNVNDVVLYPNSKIRPFHWLIAVGGSTRFSHCCIVIDGATGQGVAAREFGGVRWQRAAARDATYASVAWRDAIGMQNWLKSQVGKPYDFRAWIGCLFRLRSTAREDRYTCSALVIKALEKFGPPGITAYREATPDDVARFLGRL